MLINLDSNFSWQIKEAKRRDVRSSGHEEAMCDDFEAPSAEIGMIREGFLSKDAAR